MSKILITGGTGYIGSHTAVELQNEGYEVVIIDNLSNSRIEVLDGIEKITGKCPEFELLDLSDYEKLKDFFNRHRDITGVIHFAAFKAVGESVENPLKYYRNNLFSLVNLLKLMIEFKIYNFVFSSSCTVYGQPESLPITEETPPGNVACPYGNTKKISEEIIRDLTFVESSFKAITLRYFNSIGAHESALIGELYPGKPVHLVPFITQVAAGIHEELTVFGNDYNTPDGTSIRDYIHVSDLVRAHIFALNRMREGGQKSNFEFFNLGTGRGTSIMEIIDSFEKVSGIKLNYKIKERRPGDVGEIYADTSLADKELNWRAEKSLDDAILSAWNWQKRLSNL